jgi:hypothetical protein
MKMNIYKNNEKWTPRRWAWEFLKRKKDFIQRCDDARNLTDDAKTAAELEIAKEFRLKKFKDHTEKYSPNNPIFLSTSIYKWKGESKKRPKERKILKIRLNPGEMLIRFQVDATLNNSRAMRVQLDAAKVWLTRYREELIDAEKRDAQQKNNGTKEFGRFPIQPDKFLQRLKIIDATRRKMKTNDIYKEIFPKEFKEMNGDKDALHDRFHAEISKAKSMVDKYLEIAAIGYNPNKKLE